MGPKNIKWGKCKDEMVAEYTRRWEQWRVNGSRQYKDAFVGVAEELYGRTSGERRYTEKKKPRVMDGRGGEGSGGEAGSIGDDRRL